MSAHRPRRFPTRGGWRPPVSLLDLKLGFRMLAKHPLMTAVSVVSLALGIPVGLAPSHVIDALEAPLPVPEGERVMGLRYRSVETLREAPASAFDLDVWSEALTTFGGLGAARSSEYNLDPGTGTGAPVAGAEVSASAFPVLRAAPALGRALQAGDGRPGAPPVVVLGHDVWRSRFGADPGVVGRAVRIGDVAHTVVGVMPAGFRFPVHEQVWLPLREGAADAPGRGAALRVFGRLADGASAAEAQAELRVVQRRLSAAFPEVYAPVRAEVLPLTHALQGLPQGGRRADSGLWLMRASALALLLVACVNVGLLIFARTVTRSAELAVRAALGAARARIVGQVFAEALVLAVLSTAVGLLLLETAGNAVFAAVWSPGPEGLPWWVDLGVTPATALRAMGLAVLSAAVASVVPALRVTGGRLLGPLRRAGATGSGARMGPLSSTLIVVDIAMAVAAIGLVAGASGHLERMARTEVPGLRPEQILSVEVRLPDAAAAGAPDSAARAARLAGLQRGLLERLAEEPGVRGVAVANALPRMDHPWDFAEVEGGVPGDRTGAHEVEVARVAPGFFAALGQRVLTGRDLGGADLRGDRRAVVVNRAFAERTLGGRSPVGRRLRYVSQVDGTAGPWYEIVGMVPDLATNLSEPQNGLGIYHAAAPGELHPIRLAIRVGPDPAAFAPRVREIARDVDPSATVARAEPLDRVVPADWHGVHGLRVGWSVFVGVLLVLAASGVYAMMSFSVSQRTREIGIRSALGARPGEIAATIGRRAAVQVAAGALVGMPLAGWVYRNVLPYTSTAADVFLAALVPGITAMLGVGLVACTAPLRRALRVMPTEAMRADV